MGLREIGCRVNLRAVQTNIVYLDPPVGGISAEVLVRRLVEHGDFPLNPPRRNRVRLATHYGIETTDVDRFLAAAKEILEEPVE